MEFTITFLIDDEEVQASTGQTILEAADAAGIYIPRLCAFPGVPPQGACRLSERGRLTAAFSGQNAERVGAHTRRLREQLVDMMRQGVDEGTLRSGDPAMLASAYLGMVHNCIFEALPSGSPRPTRTPAEILSLFLDGAAGGGPKHGGTA